MTNIKLVYFLVAVFAAQAGCSGGKGEQERDADAEEAVDIQGEDTAGDDVPSTDTPSDDVSSPEPEALPWPEKGFPRAVSFRRITGDPVAIEDIAYNTVVISTLTHEQVAAARAFKETHPDKLVVAQIDYNESGGGVFGSWYIYPRQVACNAGNADAVGTILPDTTFNGFWLPGEGSLLAADSASIEVDDYTATVKVDSVAPFESLPDVLAWVYTDTSLDEIDWDRSEFFHVTAINTTTSEITLVRMWPDYPDGDSCREYARAFPPGLTYIARDSNSSTSPRKYWLPNLTRTCPDNEAGEKMVDHLSSHWADMLAPGGYLESFDGIQFDVSRYTTAGLSRMDCDVDRVRDGCMRQGENLWGHGMYDFFELLREKVGPDEVIMADANGTESQRFPMFVNGGEWENFPEGAVWDPTRDIPERGTWIRVSSLVDHYLWWSDKTELRFGARAVNYLSVKFPSELYNDCDGNLHPLQSTMLARLGFAVACMGTGHIVHLASRNYYGDAYAGCTIGLDDYPVDEFCKGFDCHDPAQARPNWLGQPLPGADGARQRQMVTSRLILPEENFEGGVGEWTQIVGGSGTEAEPLSVAATEGLPGQSLHAVITSISGSGAPGDVRIVSPTLGPEVGGEQRLVEDRDYVVSFWAKAVGPGYDDVGDRYSTIPRSIVVRFFGHAATRDELLEQSVLVGHEPRLVILTLRSPIGIAEATYDGHLEFLLGEEPGEVWIDDITVHRGCADGFYRRFEQGLVLLNACPVHTMSFDLAAIAMGGRFQRLNGMYDPAYNNGVPGSHVYQDETIDLGPWEAIFLRLADD